MRANVKNSTPELTQNQGTCQYGVFLRELRRVEVKALQNLSYQEKPRKEKRTAKLRASTADGYWLLRGARGRTHLPPYEGFKSWRGKIRPRVWVQSKVVLGNHTKN